MAHEINNPLTIILQGIQNTRRRISLELPINQNTAAECGTGLEQIHAYLDARHIKMYFQEIEDAARRAAKIITTILDFSLGDNAEKETIDVNLLLENALDLANKDYELKKLYDFGKLTIIRDYEADLPHVSCLANEIEQVMLNLLRNAAQALVMHPPVDAAPCIHLATRHEPDAVTILVADNGPGIPEEVCKRIFEPFFTTRAVGVGIGLGLSVSYFIVVTHHQGRIAVDSVPGQGTTFTISLPLNT
jgi:signal transduction histidine kinase